MLVDVIYRTLKCCCGYVKKSIFAEAHPCTPLFILPIKTMTKNICWCHIFHDENEQFFINKEKLNDNVKVGRMDKWTQSYSTTCMHPTFSRLSWKKQIYWLNLSTIHFKLDKTAGTNMQTHADQHTIHKTLSWYNNTKSCGHWYNTNITLIWPYFVFLKEGMSKWGR